MSASFLFALALGLVELALYAVAATVVLRKWGRSGPGLLAAIGLYLHAGVGLTTKIVSYFLLFALEDPTTSLLLAPHLGLANQIAVVACWVLVVGALLRGGGLGGSHPGSRGRPASRATGAASGR